MKGIIRSFKQWWQSQDRRWDDPLIEGLYADQYPDIGTQALIQAQYKNRHGQLKTPWTDPLAFDPINQPQGWRYDPYYECWIKL